MLALMWPHWETTEDTHGTVLKRDESDLAHLARAKATFELRSDGLFPGHYGSRQCKGQWLPLSAPAVVQRAGIKHLKYVKQGPCLGMRQELTLFQFEGLCSGKSSLVVDCFASLIF